MVPAPALHTLAPACPEPPVRVGAGPSLFVDEDAGFLQFQHRVLEEGRDPRTPWLERAKFLAIVGANIDDFVMANAGLVAADPARWGRLRHALLRLSTEAHRHWRVHVAPGLRQNGFDVTTYAHLTPEARARADARFRDAIRPHLHIEAWVPGSSPCPQPDGLSTCVVVYDRRPLSGAPLHVVWLPEGLPSLISVDPPRRPSSHLGDEHPHDPTRVVWTEDLLSAHLRCLVPGLAEPAFSRCRLLRHGGVPATWGHTCPTPHDVMASLNSTRRPVAAFIVDARTPVSVVRALESGFDVPPDATCRVARPFALRRLWDVYRSGPEDLRFEAHRGRVVPSAGADLWAAIRHEDRLMHHPFDSFDPVVALLEAAARDSAVGRIQMTLYRTDRESPVVAALLAAARRGADVRVLVELQTRFDEARNARTALRLTEAGARVVHAPRGLKVHAKALLIDRREDDGVRRYAHVSSGNYNGFTAATYTDVALLTADLDITHDLEQLFDALMRGTTPGPLRRIAAAPATLRRRLKGCIEREITHARGGRPSRIVLKMNALSDRETIRALYHASQAGVPIDLIVRGMCCLRPGVPGLSDTIRVRSIVGRFLEHSRIWCFHNAGADEVYIGSADLMPRNFDRRVEIMVPVTHAGHRATLRAMLTAYLHDTVKAREFGPDGSYTRVVGEAGAPALDAQAAFMT